MLDELAAEHHLERVKGFRGDEYIVCSTMCPNCAKFANKSLQNIKEYLREEKEKEKERKRKKGGSRNKNKIQEINKQKEKKYQKNN